MLGCGTPVDFRGNGADMDIRNILLLVWRRFWLLALVAVGTGTAVYLVMARAGVIPQYTATAVISIGGDMYQDAQDAAYLDLADSMRANFMHMAQLQIVTEAIIQTLQLPDSPEAVADMLDVSLVEGTNLLIIQATYSDPVTAAAMANAVIDQFGRFAPARWRNFILVLESASAPTSPDGTAVLPVILTAFVAALATSSLFFLREYLHHPFYDERDVTELLQLPTLIHLKQIPFIGWRYLRGDLLAAASGTTWWSLKEACRLRIAQHKGRADGQLVLVLSADGGLSRTLTAVQLALVWAGSGEKTLLVDLDSEQPQTLRCLLNYSPMDGTANLPDQPGTHPANFAHTVPGHPRLQVATAEPADQRSSSRRAADRLEALHALINENAVTVVNAPPVNTSLETAMIARQATLVLLVLDVRHTGYRLTAENLAILNTAGIYVDGVVLADLGNRTALFTLAYKAAPYYRRLRKQGRSAPSEDRLSYEISNRTG